MKREMEEEGEQWMAAWQGDDKDKYDERVVNIWILNFQTQYLLIPQSHTDMTTRKQSKSQYATATQH